MLVKQLSLFDLSHHMTMLRRLSMGRCPVGLILAGFTVVVLICTGFSVAVLFLGRKLKISLEQNVKEYQFYIRMPNFRPLGSIIKNKKTEGSRSP